MHQANRILIITAILLTGLISNAQKTPKTLLWRISGNGITKPSYLFGTMHMMDKRLFNFTDSVYNAIETTEGFAVEIDFRQYMDSMFMSGIKDAEDSYLERQEVRLKKDKLDKVADSLLKEFGIDGESVNKKQLKEIRDYRVSKIVQQGEMETIVDGFLYGLAQKNGKWLGAVEDVSDQLNLSDEFGGELSPEAVFVPESFLRNGIESMVKVYIEEDLDKLDEMINGYSKDYKDEVLIRRNIKMARRIDSLTSIRSMFIAVGAAHLPGEEGLIRLLRAKGFVLEPVISSKRTAGTIYKKKFASLPWFTVSDSELPYTIEMPGQPSDYDVLGQAFKMKMMFDITTMSFYMVGHTIDAGQTESELMKAFETMSKDMSGKKINPKKITGKDFISYENSFNQAGTSLKVKIIRANKHIYLLMTGSMKNSAGNSTDIKKYFESFRPREIQFKETEHVNFTIPGKAFSVKLPGEPKRNTSIDRQVEGSMWEINTYDLLDNKEQKYYLIQVRDIKEGNYLPSDSIFFDEYVKDMEQKFTSVKKEITTFHGYPALKLQGNVKGSGNFLYKVLQVIRGGRIYMMMVGGNEENMDASDSVFETFRLEEYPSSAWSRQEGPGFYTSSVAPITVPKNEVKENAAEVEDSESEFENFYSYNKNEALSYNIIRYKASPYYWIKNQDSLFDRKSREFVEEGDIVAAKKIVKNGNLPAMDLLINKAHSHLVQKVRVIVNGSDFYTLVGFFPKSESGLSYHNRFFDDFRIINEMAPSLYTNKAAMLLDSLQNPDSLIFTRAKEALSSSEFEKGDLKLLHQAVLKNYKETADYFDARSAIIEKIVELKDHSTVDFIFQNYSSPVVIDNEYQYDLLGILTNIPDAYSYQTVKKLLAKGLPKGKETWEFETGLIDSFELTRTILPEMLSLVSDSNFAEAVYDVIRQMLEKKIVSPEEVSPYKNIFLAHAARKLITLKQNNENWYTVYYWLSLISQWNEKDHNDLLREYLKIPQPGLKRHAIRELLKNEQTVPANDILVVAKDTVLRAILYDDLVGLKKTSLMPALYSTQKSIAQSEIYNFASDDNEVHSVVYEGEQIWDEGQKKFNYLLYKVNFTTDEGIVSYLGIAGPYEINSKEVITQSMHSGIYWEEVYEKKKVRELFKKYMEIADR